MDAATLPWWIWPIALFAVSFAIGIVAVLAGVGGGVLFVPIVGSFFPFHLDFVRGAGLLFGVIEALITALLGSGYTQILTFALVIVALALMPNGLFGRAEVKKV